MTDVSLILKIGKSNKKLFLFDEKLNVVHQVQSPMQPPVLQEGLLIDDLDGIWEWFCEQLREIGAGGKFQVRTVNVCTYGATVVHIDADGQAVMPVFNYASDPGGTLHDDYLDWLKTIPGGSARHGTPVMPGFLNVAKQLFWLGREHADLIPQIRYTLFLPQYFIYKLSGVLVTEATSYGCHTGLWDYEVSAPSFSMLEGLNWLSRLPRLADPIRLCRIHQEYKDMLQTNAHISVGAGLHNSASALFPYFQLMDDPFTLLSSGTWNIALNPFAPFRLTEGELAKDHLYFLTPQLQPVRTARLFAGREHDIQMKRIEEHFGHAPDVDEASFEASLKRFFAEPAIGMLIPHVMRGTGPFPNLAGNAWDLSPFQSAEEAYVRLCLDLAVLTTYCLDSVSESQDERVIYEGGFVPNPWFSKLLAMLLLPRTVHITQRDNASELGAALAVHHFWADEIPTEEILTLQTLQVEPMPGLRLYAEWLLSYYEELNG